MANGKNLTSAQKLGLKLFYTATWGGVAAATGALVSSRFTLPLAGWASFSFLTAALAMIAAGVATKDVRTSVGTLKGTAYAVIVGGLLGGLVWLSELTYPAVFTGVLGVATYSFTLWAMHTRLIFSTAYARNSGFGATVASIVITAVSIGTKGLVATPALQPILGALLGLWATMMVLAFIDAGTTKPSAVKS
jgi:hypothetical protein